MASVRQRVLAAAAMLVAAFAAQGQELGERATLLVASAANGALNEGTALIVAPFNDGHVGFMVNRRSNLMKVSGDDALHATYAVVRRDVKRSELSIGVVADLSAATIERIVRESSDEARSFASLVTWPQGRLEQEIDAGLWTLRKPDESSLFRN